MKKIIALLALFTISFLEFSYPLHISLPLVSAQNDSLLVQKMELEERQRQVFVQRNTLVENRSHLSLDLDFCMEIDEVSTFQKCQDAFLLQEDILAERKAIDKRNRVWGLSEEYCDALSLEENSSYCLAALNSQDDLCPQQEFSGNRIVVDLEDQKLYGFQNCQLLLESDVITGKNSTPTPVGEFAIYMSRQNHWMQGRWYTEKAYYFLGGYAIHDAGWRKNWNKNYRSWSGSHGCVNLPDDTMNYIWEAYGKGDIVETYAQLPESLQSEIDQQKKIREDILTVKSL